MTADDALAGPFWRDQTVRGALCFTESLSFDRRLANDDIAGSRPSARAAAFGSPSAQETGTSLAALGTVEEEIAGGTFVYKPDDEDVHPPSSAGSQKLRVTSEAGVAHRTQPQRPGGDRPPAVHQAFPGGNSPARVIALQEVLLNHARRSRGRLLAGLHPYAASAAGPSGPPSPGPRGVLARDVDRLATTRRRLDISPLGAGALAGTSLPLDPDWVARELGFSSRFENSMDAVSDRDFVAEALFDLALVGAPPVSHRGGDGPVVFGGVRVPPPRRRLRHGQFDAATEEKRGHCRAVPGQGRPLDRSSHQASWPL